MVRPQPRTFASVPKSALYSNIENITVNISDLDGWLKVAFGGSVAYYGSTTYCLNNTPITDLVIPAGTVRVNDYAFANTQFNSITIPSSVKYIGYSSLGGNNRTNVYITDVAAWCDIDFRYNAGYYNPASKLYVNGELASEISIPEGVKQIKPYAFAGNTSVKKCTLPSTLETIGAQAFYRSALESIEMNEGLKTIGDGAFQENYPKQGEPIIIPSTVNYIGQRAFYISVSGYNPKYPYFIFEGENVPETTIGYPVFPSSTNYVCYVPSNSIKEYYNTFKTNIHGFQKFVPGKANSFCSVYDGEFSEDAKVYTFSHIQDGVVYGELVENNCVEAGKPYIVVPEAGRERIAFDPVSLEGDPQTEGLADQNNAMQGVLADDCDEDKNYKTVAGSDYIVFTSEGLRLANSNGTKIKSGKCYINHDNAFSAPAGVRAVALGRYIDGDKTGIGNVGESATEQGYSINGLKSDGKGLVIYKGRKVLNKKL